MYIKEIEIQGFKSFPDRVFFSFNKGFNTITGSPNVGKSNIADAIKWALGEHSPKKLKVVEMNDVIFKGTKNRKSMGFAEVSLIIDNSDYCLPPDSSEIRITRRVFLSSKSEYLINRTPCLLKDINEIFLDTGIGKNGYCIIDKGKTDAIFNKSPKDRRKLFDEATGITKYKSRKIEAQKKLELINNNLKRINDIIFELTKWLDDKHTHPDERLKIKERYEFMVSQKNDMEILRDKLVKVISELTQNMEQQFVERIDRINTLFKKNFKGLSGEDAEIKILNGDKVLESGIEIYVQAPGKILRHVSELAGNERTLTALALLLSMRVSSLNQILIFDEIESVLDEMGISKAFNYISDNFNHTQFIFITNNSRIAEVSDSIYEIKNEQGTSIISNKELRAL